MKPRLSILTVVILIALADFATAQRPGARGQGEPAGGGRGGRMMQQGQARGGHGHGSAAQTSPLFAALDKDKDGKLSRVELEQAVAALKKLDTDRDGYLSPSECAPRGGHGHGHGGASDPQAEATETVNTLMGFDKNDDGSLTKEELPERMQNVIARADTNGGEIASKNELMAMALKEATPVSQGRGRRGGRGRFRQGAAPSRPELESNNDQ